MKNSKREELEKQKELFIDLEMWEEVSLVEYQLECLPPDPPQIDSWLQFNIFLKIYEDLLNDTVQAYEIIRKRYGEEKTEKIMNKIINREIL